MTPSRWDAVTVRRRTAHRLALRGHADPADHAVLEAVLHLLGDYQRFEDRLSLTQVAQHAGLCPWNAEPSRHERREAGRHLAALAGMGALEYEPRSGKQLAGLVRLPQPDRTLFTDDEW